NNETLLFLQSTATELGITIQGSRTLIPSPNAKATNNATIIAPDGRLLCEYAKIHPFTFGKEPEAFAGGDESCLYTWTADNESLQVCPAVCYDLRFPELFRRGLLAGAEAFAIGANWPQTRQAHWRALAIARAIENQAYVFAVNRTGSDPHLAYAGGSIAIDPQGKVLGELDEKPDTLTVEVHPENVRNWRSTFPAWRDLKIRTLN
ncbi:MAG TPA: carbon-nitrogen family hydrolase, partial [Phycisphaerales bacterium]|nr:carbon-nitrogen family hydrolase [Phycisphaerales bacterium]